MPEWRFSFFIGHGPLSPDFAAAVRWPCQTGARLATGSRGRCHFDGFRVGPGPPARADALSHGSCAALDALSPEPTALSLKHPYSAAVGIGRRSARVALRLHFLAARPSQVFETPLGMLRATCPVAIDACFVLR